MDEKLKSSIFTEIVSRSVKDVLKKIFYTLHHKQHSSQIQSALAQMINFVVLESSAALSQLSTVISSKFDLNEGDYEKAEFRSDKFISRISFFFNCNIHPRSIKKLFLKGIRLTLEDIIFIDSRIEKMFDHNLCDWTPLIHCFFPKRLPNSFFFVSSHSNQNLEIRNTIRTLWLCGLRRGDILNKITLDKISSYVADLMK